MPDFFNVRTNDRAPESWREAFAALPMETPPADGWARIARALDAPASHAGALRRERRMSWAIGLASAAVLALAAWSPLSRWLQQDTRDATPAIAATEAPGLRGPAAPVRNDPPAVQAAAMPLVEDVDRSAVVEASPRPAVQPQRKPPRNARAVAKRSDATGVAAGAAEPAVVAAATQTETAELSATAEAEPLQRLKAQSAQLEALVTLARDDRVANASSELLSSELDAGIAAVDAALSQPDLAEARRHELWQQRVDLLQQLAGVEATSRWLAAQGASGEATLVSVY